MISFKQKLCIHIFFNDLFWNNLKNFSIEIIHTKQCFNLISELYNVKIHYCDVQLMHNY